MCGLPDLELEQVDLLLFVTCVRNVDDGLHALHSEVGLELFTLLENKDIFLMEGAPREMHKEKTKGRRERMKGGRHEE